MIRTIIKRDGTTQPYNYEKIITAISKALTAAYPEKSAEDIEKDAIVLATGTSAWLNNTTESDTIHTEQVQDAIETALMGFNYTKAAKEFILYRSEHSKLRAGKLATDIIGTYLDKSDWRVRENSNSGYCYASLMNHVAGTIIANYCLENVYSHDVANAHIEGDIHLHDLSAGVVGYCFTGETKVRCLDGNAYSFKELVDTNVKELQVYAVKNGKIHQATAVNPRITRSVNDTLTITISGGAKIECTLDHKFMLRDGSYVEAQQLKVNDSLMPLYVGGKRYSRIDYYEEGVYTRAYVHRYMMEDLLGRKLSKDECVHHKNGNKLDNRYSNLELMKDTEHRAMELASTRSTTKWQEANNKRLVAYNKSSDKRSAVSAAATTRPRDAAGRFYNHKVIAVQHNHYDNPVDMYDITVPGYDNFALDAGVFVHNCAGWSIRDLLMKGFIGKYGRANAGPAKHLDTALLQAANFLCTLQTEWAGAQAFNSFDTFMAPFVRKDNLDYEAVKQRVQQFVFGLNIASRYGQCPFTNLTFDLTCPEDMKEQPVIIGGEPQDTTYGEYQKEMDMINKAFIEVMMNGDKDGRIFSFPIPTYNITEDFPWDSEVAHLLFKMTGKLGAPYFQNFINTDLNPSDVRSMCCRLRLDLTDIRKHTGGLFGAGDQTGSIGVVSINVPRIAYLANKTEDPKQEFYRLYDQRLMLAKKALEAKRREINKNFDNGLMPYSQEYLPHKFTRHFSTIGVIGFNEAMVMLLGKTMGDEESIQFVKDVINYTLKKCEAFTEETGNMYNFEAVPGEGLSYRFAKIDKKKYPDIITAGTDESPYYTNSSQLPVNYTDDPFEALELQGDIQSMYSSGTVLHFYIGECIDEEEVVAKFVKNVCKCSKLPFFSLTPEFSICPKCGYIRGIHETCPNHC